MKAKLKLIAKHIFNCIVPFALNCIELECNSMLNWKIRCYHIHNESGTYHLLLFIAVVALGYVKNVQRPNKKSYPYIQYKRYDNMTMVDLAYVYVIFWDGKGFVRGIALCVL